jgi:hypothetical protein
VRNRPIACLLAFAFLATAQTFAAAAPADQIDDPGYVHWSKFKPGSTTKTLTLNESAGLKISIQITTTLLAVTPEKITVEIISETDSSGTKLSPRTRKQDVAAKRAKPADPSLTKESKETLTFAGKSYRCTLSEETRGTLHIKTWLSDEIPGGLLKAQITDDGVSITTNLVDFKKA